MPRIVAAVPAAGNVLTARVTLAVPGLDSARVIYQSAQDGVHWTPARRVTGDSVTLVVAGMRQGDNYRFQVEGWHAGALSLGDTTRFITDSVPEPLRSLHYDLTVGAGTDGFILLPMLLGTTPYLVVLDGAGQVRWYLDTSPYYPVGPPADIQQLPNGHLVAYLGGTRGWDPIFGRFCEFDLEGHLVRSYTAPAPLYTDNHDLIVQFADSVPVAAIFFGYDIRSTDLTAVGGAANVALAGHQLLRQRLDGSTGFFWNAWDHLTLAEWVEEPQTAKLASSGDFDHPNTVAIDLDSNYVVSWRNLGLVTKIDARTGAILWRWGGLTNQFTFVNDPEGLFSGQHSVRVLPDGNYLIYDNGLRHVPPETRIAEYRLDPTALTATLVWEYHHSPPLYTPFLGRVARLTTGNTFIGWGGAGIVQEVAPDKATVWEAALSYQGTAVTFYRAEPVPDLYSYREP